MLLEKAFHYKINAKNDVIKKLSQLELGTHGDPYTFIGEVRTITSACESLQITVDDIQQYFVWQGLNPKFQEHLVHITNKSNPSIGEILEHFFEGTNRYLKSNPSQGNQKFGKKEYVKNSDASEPNISPSRTTSMAVNVRAGKGGEVYCSLCKSDNRKSDHNLRSCDFYDTPSKKVNKLKSINGCIKCSYASHCTKNCKFNFRSNCRNCDMPHMTFLCLKTNVELSANYVAIGTGNDYENEQNYDDVEVSTSVVEISNVQGTDAVLLPTFTAHILDGNGTLNKVRIFKDSGCQRVFIRTDLSDKLNLEILKNNLPLNIHGFLSKAKVDTKLVKVNLVIDGKVLDVDAICIDKISTKFDTGDIEKIISNFKNQGYRFADAELEVNMGVVKNIDIVLGTEYDHILPTTDIVFGDNDQNHQSLFKNSKIGVLLSGKVSKIIENLQYLPKFTEYLPINFSPSTSAPALNSFRGNVVKKRTDVTTSYVSSESKDKQLSRVTEEETLNISEVYDDENLNYVTNLKLTDFILNNSINIIPSLQGAVEDPSYGEEAVSNRCRKLSIVRSNLVDEYQPQFLRTLLTQATDRKGKYRPERHIPLEPGDVVMLVEKHSKQYSYDIGRVKSVNFNNIGEVTAAQVFNIKTRETVYRHITSLILLVPFEEVRTEEESTPQIVFGECLNRSETRNGTRPRPRRRAAAACRTRLAATDY